MIIIFAPGAHDILHFVSIPISSSQFISLIFLIVVRARFGDNKLVVEYTRFIRLFAHHHQLPIDSIRYQWRLDQSQPICHINRLPVFVQETQQVTH